MELDEFDRLAEPLRQRSAAAAASYGFALIEGLTATAEQIAAAEQTLGVILPVKYKTFMTRYGGGMFGFVDLLPIAADDKDDICSVNRGEFPDASFIAIAPVGTGDFWGFPATAGFCHDQVKLASDPVVSHACGTWKPRQVHRALGAVVGRP